jgi:hypothetical protein
VINDYTSTGAKFFHHQEAMKNLRNGKGQPIVTHVMLTDVCNHTCAFCSVQARAGDSLPFQTVIQYLATLQSYGLKAVILSGGGNPILYKCKETGRDFNDVVRYIHSSGLEIGLITNGMPLTSDRGTGIRDPNYYRRTWKTVRPETLDKLTWVRISMAGLDHKENEVYVPDIDPAKTTLGFSYVAHDIYNEPADPHHGKDSTKRDLLSGDRAPTRSFEERMLELLSQIGSYVVRYKPRYVRLLPNCLEPELIPARVRVLQRMADSINDHLETSVVFVQNKPPAAPKACYLGYIHPVLNCDGYVYPCDSCVLNESAEHQFANPWRMCHWSEIGKIYDAPVRSLIADPAKTCPGCVFTKSNAILTDVVEGGKIDIPHGDPTHVNFV